MNFRWSNYCLGNPDGILKQFWATSMSQFWIQKVEWAIKKFLGLWKDIFSLDSSVSQVNEFLLWGLKLVLDFRLKLWNYCILWMNIMPSQQKLAIILENKMFKNWSWKIVFSCYNCLNLPWEKFFQVWVTFFPVLESRNTAVHCWEKVVQVRGLRLRICDLLETLPLLKRTGKTSNKLLEKTA